MTACLLKMEWSARPGLSCLHEDSPDDGVDHEPHDVLHNEDQMARGQSRPPCAPPKPMVTWTSTVKRKADEKEWMLVTQGTVALPGQVTVGEGDEPPDMAAQPAAQERHGEDEQRVWPLEIHGADHVPSGSCLVDVLVGHAVVPAALEIKRAFRHGHGTGALRGLSANRVSTYSSG